MIFPIQSFLSSIYDYQQLAGLKVIELARPEVVVVPPSLPTSIGSDGSCSTLRRKMHCARGERLLQASLQATDFPEEHASLIVAVSRIVGNYMSYHESSIVILSSSCHFCWHGSDRMYLRLFKKHQPFQALDPPSVSKSTVSDVIRWTSGGPFSGGWDDSTGACENPRVPLLRVVTCCHNREWCWIMTVFYCIYGEVHWPNTHLAGSLLSAAAYCLDVPSVRMVRPCPMSSLSRSFSRSAGDRD